MNWREGKQLGSIITDPPPEEYGFTWTDSERDQVEYYDGRVVCESVDARFRPMICALPDLLREAKALLAKMDAVPSGGGPTACIFARHEFDGLRAVVSKMEGQVPA